MFLLFAKKENSSLTFLDKNTLNPMVKKFVLHVSYETNESDAITKPTKSYSGPGADPR